MDASKSKYLLREASSEPSLSATSALVVGAVVLLAASQAFAQSASEQTANDGRMFQPQVYDFSWKNRQKAETKKLLQNAREAAAQGHAQKARGLIQQAAELPINWDLEEASPQTTPHEHNGRTSGAEVQTSGRPFAEIPSVSELAEPSTVEEEQAETPRESFRRQSQRKTSVGHSADVRSESLTSSQQLRSASGFSSTSNAAHEESNPSMTADQPTEAEQINAGRGREAIVLHTTSTAPSTGDVHGREVAAVTTSLSPTVNSPTTNSEQALVSYSIIILSALFGAVVVLIGLLLFLLKKFGPNPTFVFKVEMTNSGRDTLSNERPAPPPSLRIAPIYAMKMQEEAEREQQQEEAMMRKVFEDNLELRDQLQATRHAA